MAYPKIKISDNVGKTVDVTDNNELKVKLSDSVTVTATDLSVALDASGDSVECIQDTAAHLLATVTQASPNRVITSDNSSVECIQDTPGDLTATVTQASDSRTVNLITGYATSALQGGGLPAALTGSGSLKVSIEEGNISGFATSGGQLADGHTVAAMGNTTASGSGSARHLNTDTDGHLQIDVVSAALGTVQVQSNSANLATAGGQLAAGHTIDCNASYIKIKAEDGTALTDGTNSGKLDVSIHSADGNAFSDTAGKMNVHIGGDSSGGVEVVQDTAADLNATVTGTVGHDITGMVSGVNSTVSDSTAEQLDGSTDSSLDVACKRVDLMATQSNTGDIWVGDSGVTSNGAGGGMQLKPGDFYSIDVNNLNDIWVIATVDEENIHYMYFT